MNEFDQPYQYRSRERSPYQNRSFLNNIKNSLNQLIHGRKDESEAFIYLPRDDFTGSQIISSDSMQQYAQVVKRNNRSTFQCRDTSIQNSPTHSETKTNKVIFPKILVPKTRVSVPKRKKKPKMQLQEQNPQDCQEQDLFVQTIDTTLQSLEKPKKMQIPKTSPVKMIDRFEQLMKYKHDEQLSELKQLIKKVQKPKNTKKKRVTFSVDDY